MIVKRDFLDTLRASSQLEAVLIWGPRQVGKTTLLDQLDLKSKIFLDDLGLRQTAEADPALALEGIKLPCLIDEVQYAPNLFPEIKKRIDKSRRDRLKVTQPSVTDYYLTGSNRLMLDTQIKETLAGRCHLFALHGFSIREIQGAFPGLSLKTCLFKGGFPELYTRRDLLVPRYLNDYILSFVEKDIAQSAGIAKLNEFQTVLRLLAARTGQFINISEVAGAAGVDQKTVQFWIDTLARNFILALVPCYASNLSKRITRMKKLYFYDVGLCARLQGHQDEDLLWNSPQSGSLFETMVFSEIIKTRDNFLRDWRVYSWRTKEQNEIDFVVETTTQAQSRFLFIEAKLGIHGVQPYDLDPEASKVFRVPHKKIVVSAGGDRRALGKSTEAVSLLGLGDFLLTELSQ